jgi:ubiquitin carboxyl-terminal hydrolase L3
MSPEDRADALGKHEVIAASHEAAAHHGTEEPVDTDVRVDTHFITFVAVDGALYELDGRKPWPVNHGPTSAETMLADAARVIKANFMDLDPRELRFNIMALAPPM